MNSRLISCFLLVTASLRLLSSAEAERAPLFGGLGHLQCPVTTTNALAQRYFDQGLTLCYAFNHAEAERSFRYAAALDPACAMAYWGMAYSRGPHINKPMSPQDTAAAWNAIRQALDHKGSASRKEQAWIDALARRYEPQHHQDRSALDRAYADAMRDLVRKYPDDLDLETLFAEALMDTTPWDYWQKDHSLKSAATEALKALQFVHARDPDHPGANHFFIHIVEAGPHPEAGLAAAINLENYAPEAGHLVHMPSHIYMRVGDYERAVTVNQRAVNADHEYLRQCRAQGVYPAAYYPHNLHFLWWALVFTGRSSEALVTAQRAVDYAADNVCTPNRVPQAVRLRHLPWLTMARFGHWDLILKVAEPPITNDFLVDRAFWHFTRGLAFVAQNQAPAAAQESAELHKLRRGEDAKALENPHLPLTRILEVADEWLAGKVAGVRGETASMIGHLKNAVSAEDALPYMEPAYWPFPVRPTLGAALLQANDPQGAERVFRDELERMPRDPWALFGLEKALSCQRRREAADEVHRQFEAVWLHADTLLKLSWF
jgi:tetratricopeptide (TPR) repeat protein